MNPATEQLLQTALALPEEERVEFVEALIAACDTEPPFSEAWLAEIQRRSAQIDSGEAVLTPWEEVKRRVHDRVFGKPRET